MTEQRAASSLEAVFREDRSRLLALLAARFGDLDLAEDVTSEAVEAALERWPTDGVPDKPLPWLLTTARRKAVDRIRRDRTYADRLTVLHVESDRAASAPRPEPGFDDIPDERLELFFTCCHPALTLEARTALTLRFLAGLTTAEGTPPVQDKTCSALTWPTKPSGSPGSCTGCCRGNGRWRGCSRCFSSPMRGARPGSTPPVSR